MQSDHFALSDIILILQVIQYETQRDKVVLGCSVFGYSDVYRKLRPLLQKFQELRRSCKKPAQPPQLCLISADVSQAFDSINVSKLMGIVEPLLKSPHYLIRKHAEVLPSTSLLKYRPRAASCHREHL